MKSPASMSYIGKVTSNTDPHKRGRVKVVIPRYNNETELWAYPVSPILGGGSGTQDNPSTNSWGFYGAPQVGDHVLLIALDGDMNTLFYIGAINSKNQNLPEAKTTPDNLQLRMPNGHTLVFRTGSDTSIELTSAGGQTLKIDDAANNISVSAGSTAITLSKNGDINISTTANININATGNVTIVGALVDINP